MLEILCTSFVEHSVRNIPLIRWFRNSLGLYLHFLLSLFNFLLHELYSHNCYNYFYHNLPYTLSQSYFYSSKLSYYNVIHSPQNISFLIFVYGASCFFLFWWLTRAKSPHAYMHFMQIFPICRFSKN